MNSGIALTLLLTVVAATEVAAQERERYKVSASPEYWTTQKSG
jgi:hypothetical protein